MVFQGSDAPTPEQRSDAVERLRAGEVQWDLPATEHDVGRFRLIATRVDADSLAEADSASGVGFHGVKREIFEFSIELRRGERAVSRDLVGSVDVAHGDDGCRIDARIVPPDDRIRRSEVARHVGGVIASIVEQSSLPASVEGHDAGLLEVMAGLGFLTAIDLRDDSPKGPTSWLVERRPDESNLQIDRAETVDAAVLARVGRRLLDFRPRTEPNADEAPVLARSLPTDLLPEAPEIFTRRLDSDEAMKAAALSFGPQLARRVEQRKAQATVPADQQLRSAPSDSPTQKTSPAVTAPEGGVVSGGRPSVLVGLLALVGLLRGRSIDLRRPSAIRRPEAFTTSHQQVVEPLIEQAQDATKSLLDNLIATRPGEPADLSFQPIADSDSNSNNSSLESGDEAQGSAANQTRGKRQQRPSRNTATASIVNPLVAAFFDFQAASGGEAKIEVDVFDTTESALAVEPPAIDEPDEVDVSADQD
jgi:hypothetical protein